MFGFLKKLFGGSDVDFKALVNSGAQIIDVRTTSEFSNGHIKNSKNIPLQDLNSQMNSLSKDKPVITVCASGMRSASAKGMLQKNGFEVYNGGGWSSLQNKLLK